MSASGGRQCCRDGTIMTTTLTIRDATTAGKKVGQWTVEIPAERITVRELIRRRVYQEVKDYNTRQPAHFRGLVRPTDAEETLNGYRLKKQRQIDWRKQFDNACEAFERNQVLILVGDRQAESLDEEIEIKPGTEVTFLKLMLLVGG